MPARGPDAIDASKPEVRFDEVLGDSQAQPTDPVKGVVADLAARVRQGELSAAAAVDRLVEAVVHRRVGRLDPALQQQLRDSLQRAVAEDPLLAARLARVDRVKDD